jgi:hypothetical protein
MIKMPKTFILLIFLFFLFGCAQDKPFHTVLGSSYGFSGEEITILRDAKVGDLRIRHVRNKDTSCVGDVEEWLEIEGAIGPDSTAAVEKLLPIVKTCVKKANNTKVTRMVYMSSGGGLLVDGLKMGRLFRKHRIQTAVIGDQICASSCAIAFIGGVNRTMHHDALISLHAPYSKYGFSINCLSTSETEPLKFYFNGMLGPETGNYLYDRMMSYCSTTTGWSLNADAAKLFGIIW